MNFRSLGFGVLLLFAFFAGAYWQRSVSPVAPAEGQSESQAMPPTDGPSIETGEASSVGIDWDVPSRWKNTGATSTRLATYDVPPPGGGESAECAVFYFGPGQGGDVESNLDRWIGQFENARGVSRATKTYGGMSVGLVSVEGDYLAPSGPMMESDGTRKGFMLRGAIVAGPNGNVFFKFTGPKRAVSAAAGEFDGMLQSLRRS